MNIEIPVEELRKRKLFVATPMYGGQCFGSYTKSILDLSQLCQSYGIAAQFSFLFNESLITRARNYMVDEFLRTEHTHMMFIDSDIDFNPMDVIALLAMDKPIIGGPYPKKCIAWENVYDAVRLGLVKETERGRLVDFAGDFVFNAVPGTTEIQLNQPTEVLEIGTGFMLIERSVFTKFADTYPQYWYNPDHNRSAAFDGSRKIYQYFQAEIEPTHNRYLSEDYWFCQKARAAGVSVWLAPWMKIKHHGTYIYGGDIPSMATVVHSRIANNLAAPGVIHMDHTQKGGGTPDVSGPVPASKLSIAQLSSLSATKRKAFFADLAASSGLAEDVLRARWAENREAWLSAIPDAPVASRLTTAPTTPSSVGE